MFKRIAAWLAGLAVIAKIRQLAMARSRRASYSRLMSPVQRRWFASAMRQRRFTSMMRRPRSAFPWQRRASRMVLIRPLVLGLGLGAAGMYLFNTRMGSRRRALLGDQATHLAKETGDAFDKAGRDLRNRATGAAAEMQRGPGQAFGQQLTPAVGQDNWSPGVRMLGGLAGTALAASTFRLGGVPRVAGSALGLGLLARSVTNLPVKRLVGVGAGRRAVDIQKAIVINAPVREVFDFYSNFENFPRFMTNVREVRDLGEGRSHWVVDGPAGITAEWDARMTAFEPDRLIAWRSEEQSMVGNAGVARFDPEPKGGTRISVRMSYNPPGGALGHAVATLFNSNPKQEMNEDLGRLKTLIETGKTSAGGRQVRREDLAPRHAPGPRPPEPRPGSAPAPSVLRSQTGAREIELPREQVEEFTWEGRQGDVPRPEWEQFCNSFGQRYAGWLATVDETDASGRRRTIASEQTLQNLSYEREGGAFNLRLVFGDDANLPLAHVVADVQSLRVESGDAGVAEGLSVSAMQGTTHVRLRAPGWSGAGGSQ
jgi:uncharacterized membrane protein